MSAILFAPPHYYAPPCSFGKKVANRIEGYFDRSSPGFLTALKVISYFTVILPVLVFAIRTIIRSMATLSHFFSSKRVIHQPSSTTLQTIPISAPAIPDSKSESPVAKPSLLSPHRDILDRTPVFAGYKIGPGTPYESKDIKELSLRPANLFYDSLLGPGAVTLPGSNKRFDFNLSPSEVRARIQAKADRDEVIAISAKGVAAKIHCQDGAPLEDIPDLAPIFGEGTYRLSGKEVQSLLESQKIYTAPLLPLAFYKALKQAMNEDRMAVLPFRGSSPTKLREIQKPHCRAFVEKAHAHFAEYGFADQKDCERLLNLTFFQLGSLVVKVEDFHFFIDEKGKIWERNPDQPDTIRLINGCAIHKLDPSALLMRSAISNQKIMTQGFATALRAAESGHFLFPAVGMVKGTGDPDLYWRAFLDAVLQYAGPLEQIFVNPRHERTIAGNYKGSNGEEFQRLLDEYRTHQAKTPEALANLAKVVNLFDRNTDLLHLSRALKATYPEKTISLFNESDPEITLGNRMGRHVNLLSGESASEENYTVLGTKGLCFEAITGVHEDPARLLPEKGMPKTIKG